MEKTRGKDSPHCENEQSAMIPSKGFGPDHTTVSSTDRTGVETLLLLSGSH